MLYLDIAHEYAKKMSGCQKVQVGSVIVKNGNIISIGANVALPDLCKYRGCLRVELYGEDSKNHRLPSDCRAIHSEIHAISRLHESAAGATIYITRYPCEACARAIVSAGIKRVVWGRGQDISDQTKELFEKYGVEYRWEKGWTAEDTER